MYIDLPKRMTNWLLSVCVIASFPGATDAADDPRVLTLGKFKLTAPREWTRKQPASSIVAYEFSIPASKGDEQDGRMTVMSAGGGVEANVDRWYGQFTQPDGKPTKDVAKRSRLKLADQDVHIVDISGTYTDMRGPVARGPAREDYRMLGAIIPTKEADFYVKFYGPRQTVAEHEKAFLRMIESLERR